MVMCQRCGRTLTWPKSLERGFGPVCWKKVQGKMIKACYGYIPPENLDLERKLLVFLHKRRNVTVSSTSARNHRRREREWRKKGYTQLSDFGYHSYSRLTNQIADYPLSEFVAICFDEYSRTVDKKRYSAMTVSLMEKVPTMEIPLREYL